MSSPLHSLAFLPDLGGGEMMLVLLVVLLLFGGDKMPQLAKSVGKSLRQFKKAAAEVEQEIKRAIDEVPDAPDLRATVREAVEDKPKRLVPASGPVGAPPAVATPVNPPPSAATTTTPNPAAPQPPPTV